MFNIICFSITIIDGCVIDNIIFKSIDDNKIEDESILIDNISINSGDKFIESNLNSSIKQLYDMNCFINIKTNVKYIDDKVDIVFMVEKSPTIDNVKFIREYIDILDIEKDIKKYLSIINVKNFTYKLLSDNIKIINEIYKKYGYYDVKVDSVLKYKLGKIIDIHIYIKNNILLKINSVIFKGNKLFSDKKLQNIIHSKHSYLQHIYFPMLFTLNGIYNPYVVSLDEAKIKQLYNDNSYYNVIVKSTITKGDKLYNKNKVDIIFNIDESDIRYRIKNINIYSKNKILTRQEILDIIPLKIDRYLNKKLEQESILNIKKKLLDIGYSNLNCTIETELKYYDNTVSININIDEGNLYIVDDIYIIGNKITEDNVIRSQLNIQPYDIVNNKIIEESKNILLNKHYIDNVEIKEEVKIDYDKKNTLLKDIFFVVTEAKINTYRNFKFGFGNRSNISEFSPNLIISYFNMNFNIFDPKNYFTGGGESFIIDMTIASLTNGGNFEFFMPFNKYPSLNLNLQVKYEYNKESYKKHYKEKYEKYGYVNELQGKHLINIGSKLLYKLPKLFGEANYIFDYRDNYGLIYGGIIYNNSSYSISHLKDDACCLLGIQENNKCIELINVEDYKFQFGYDRITTLGNIIKYAGSEFLSKCEILYNKNINIEINWDIYYELLEMHKLILHFYIDYKQVINISNNKMLFLYRVNFNNMKRKYLRGLEEEQILSLVYDKTKCNDVLNFNGNKLLTGNFEINYEIYSDIIRVVGFIDYGYFAKNHEKKKYVFRSTIGFAIQLNIYISGSSISFSLGYGTPLFELKNKDTFNDNGCWFVSLIPF